MDLKAFLGSFNIALFFYSMGNVIWHIGVFFAWSEFSFCFSFCLQSVLKLFFHLLFFTASFEDATKKFIVIYFFFLKESRRLFA
jgi:hypothetical protein